MSEYKCITLKGEFSDMGKHILLPFGCCLCGLPTVDAIGKMPQLENPALSDLVSEYKEEKEWDITCEKCLNVYDIIKQKKDKDDAIKN
jgi:hypothetical protein